MIPALNPQSRIRAVNSERAAESARWHRAGFRCYWRWKSRPNTMLEKADRPAHRVISKSRFTDETFAEIEERRGDPLQ